MKTLFLILSFFTVFSSIAQKDSDLILEISKLDQSNLFYISLGEEIIFTTIIHKHKRHGFISDICTDSMQINNSYYIKYNNLKSLISKKERKSLHTKAWGTTIVGLLLTVGGGGLLQNSSSSQQVIGGAGVIFGTPYLIKGIRMVTSPKICHLNKWKIQSISFSTTISLLTTQ